MQIREMYQLQIQLKQAAAMRILAVVSVIFLPLTLLVGWYDMNFEFSRNCTGPGLIRRFALLPPPSSSESSFISVKRTFCKAF